MQVFCKDSSAFGRKRNVLANFDSRSWRNWHLWLQKMADNRLFCQNSWTKWIKIWKNEKERLYLQQLLGYYGHRISFLLQGMVPNR
jgi:hypothetical protein